MRTHQLKLLATGFLTAAVSIFIFNWEVSSPEVRGRTTRPQERIAPRGQDLAGSAPADSKRREHPAESESVASKSRRIAENGRASASRDAGPVGTATQEEHPERSAPARGPQARLGVPRAIQLATTVQLPAALMAKGTWAANPSLASSPAAMAANEEIVNSFYRELSERLSETPATRDGESPTKTDSRAEDNTVIVDEGPVVQDARERANQRFRTLYGNDAYNRLTMNAAIEQTLED